MKEVVVASWDDVDLASEQKIPAGVTVTVSLRVEREDTVSEQVIELDLTEDHAAEMEGDFATWMVFGHAPQNGSKPVPQPRRSVVSRKKGVAIPPIDRVLDGLDLPVGSRERTVWLARLREWADQNGRDEYRINPEGGERTSYYYPRELVRDYLAFLGMQQEAG